MYIGLFAFSVLTFVIFILFANKVYKKEERKRINFLNTFPYEITQKIYKNFYLFLPLFLFALSLFINNVIYTIKIFETWKIVSSIFLLIAICSAVSLFFVPLNKYREHITLYILEIVSLFAAIGLNLYNEINLYLIDNNALLLIPIIIDSLALLLIIFGLFNSSDKNLVMDSGDDGLTRPKMITIAFFEWLNLVLTLLSQISIIVITMI